jgi:type III pantothenate kinase
MVTLCIDNGNTLTKCAVFKNDEMINFRAIDPNNYTVISQVIQNAHIEAAIMSSVSAVPDTLMKSLRKEVKNFILLDHQTPLPIENCYETKETLGKDRLAAVLGAHHLYPADDLLVIDAGTAITYDIINHHGQYLGGNISPGLQMRFKALNYFTTQLPLLNPVDKIPDIGKNTTEAIEIGVQQGILFEVEGTIEHYKQSYPHLKVLMTGGDAKFFDNKLKSMIFVVSNLVMIGLNRILKYNLSRQ